MTELNSFIPHWLGDESRLNSVPMIGNMRITVGLALALSACGGAKVTSGNMMHDGGPRTTARRGSHGTRVLA